ncbi:uncharacterized protein troap isoform X2 [Trichomycterus rosablanca]|uniref:uncharacterized protein troap isoform X2 n=1 Tax=Trichomycterus rosablanca TaxID=2290929 RepID=UPI002F35BE81
MASSSSLHPKSNNHREHTGVLKPQEQNKVSEHVRTKIHKTNTQLCKKDVENQDPNAAKPTKGGSKMLGVSRLPVLAKSLHSAGPDTSEETGHKKWEERPLLGKVQKKKMCTKPVPFNFSQPRIRNQKSTEAPSETARDSGITLTHLAQQLTGKTPNKHRLQTSAKHSRNPEGRNIALSLKCHTFAGSKLKNANADEELLSNKVAPSVQRDLRTQLDTETDGADHKADYPPINKGRIQTLVSARCTTELNSAVTQTPRPFICPSGSGSSVYLPERVSVKKKGCRRAEAVSEKTVLFSPDPSALSSILLNEGVKVGGTDGATPRGSICPSGRGVSIYSAQRVPIKRPQTHTAAAAARPAGAEPFSPDPSALRSILLNEGVKAGAVTTPRCSVAPSGRKTSIYSAQRVPVKKTQTEAVTFGGTVPFSPDPVALSSILLNEGVKVGGPTGTTPRVSVCPSRRGTSIYSAQRVPVRKPRAEEAGRTGASQTPTLKGTPQRVPLSQSQSVRRLISRHKTPLVSESPGFSKTQAPNTDGSAKQEEDVVQRLFQEEQECENEQMQKEGEDVSPCHLLQHHQPTETGRKLEDSMDQCRLEEENKPPAAQPFIQAPHRQSVIVFGARAQMPQDTGQTQPCVAQSGDSAPLVQTVGSQGDLKSDQNKVLSPGGLCKTKASSLSMAACVLRRRLPPLEELFLDDECATYTSRQQFWPAQPRCINPVASLLLFQDSTCFVPISWTSSSLGPVSHLSSPIRA